MKRGNIVKHLIPGQLYTVVADIITMLMIIICISGLRVGGE